MRSASQKEGDGKRDIDTPLGMMRWRTELAREALWAVLVSVRNETVAQWSRHKQPERNAHLHQPLIEPLQ